MALSIPIVSEFDGKGIDKAIKEFKQLETVGEKAQFAIRKAAVPAAAAITAVAGALGLAAKAAAEDEQQQAILANTMQNVVGATDATVAATEDMISVMSRATGTADSELRPAFAALLVGTKNVGEATSALGIAQDIATATGTDLATVSDALAKAYAGNMKGLAALSPEMKGLIKDGADLDTVMLALNDNFGGAAAKSAGTAAGQFKILKNSIGEFQESLGALLLPVIMQVLPKLQMLADWAQANPEKFMNVAKAVTAVSVAVLAMNIAVNAHPLIAIGSALLTLVGYLVFAYNKFETFRNVVNGVFNSIMATMQGFVNAFNSVINVLIRAYNLLNFGSDVPYIPQITLPRMGGESGSAVSGGGAAREGGTGSITAALPSMPSLVSPIRGGGGGAGGGGGSAGGTLGVQGLGGAEVGALTTFGNAERIAARSSGGVTINVTGGMSTSAEIGQSVLNSLLAYQRTNGPLDLQIAS
jgi:uncharacterized membrane protein YjjP (DUF1212 family)